ncbi:MAG TPA: beta-ketoacyl-[acyl-carrier-protein] synthase family protein [Pyrinomonadaceae bacterium]|jgi:3-oxoacyl-[acyl-carrier-protein] synthase II|nr:beta-ketoacyl-[acyl-carrier-protein] synthase family protein [Pyrinomonadaceae bacterium]
MPERRVVITGIGVVSAIGIGKNAFWQGLISGKSGISDVDAFDTSEFPCRRGGQVRDFVPSQYLSADAINRLAPVAQFAVAAAKMAVADSRLNGNMEPERTSVAMGTTNGEASVIEKICSVWVEEGYEQIDPKLLKQYPMHLIPAHVAMEFGAEGSAVMMPNACSAGNWAIGFGSNLIKSDEADVVLAGGCETLARGAFIGFNRSFAMAPEMCQPFDKNRKGLMPGEGAAVLVLESLDKAERRGAHIYAEVTGFGVSCDTYHITGPDPTGRGAVDATISALKTSGLKPEDIDYVSAHGTGTKPNDRVETLATKKVFGDLAKRIPMSSIKSMIGHSFGAASAIEAAACSLIIENGMIPPTINYREPDPECDLDYVPNEAREHKVDALLSNAYAFGGNCAVLALRAMR